MKYAICNWNNNIYRSYSVDGEVRGTVFFSQENENSPVIVYVNLIGIPKGYHGIHIHEKAFLVNMLLENKNCCDLLGGHFNPDGLDHGYHAGDLCFNIYSKGRLKEVEMVFFDDKISLFPGKYNIIGRSLVIHKNKDDEGRYWLYPFNKSKREESKKTGNAGERIACSAIEEYKEK